MHQSELEKMRQAVADYMQSEGCSCCRGSDHDKHRARLAELLKVPPHPEDKTFFDFAPFQSNSP